MNELTNFSIETDHSVWLSFNNGQTQRVSYSQLSRFLAPPDLIKVRRAIELRHNFIRNTLPKTMVAAIVLGLVGLILTTSHSVARLWRPLAPETAPGRSFQVRSAQPSPGLKSHISGSALSFVTGAKPRHVAAHQKPVSTLSPARPLIVVPEVMVTPMISPNITNPVVPAPGISPSPLASPLPSPDEPPATSKLPSPNPSPLLK